MLDDLDVINHVEYFLETLWEKLWHLEAGRNQPVRSLSDMLEGDQDGFRPVDRIWANMSDRLSPMLANSIHANIEYLEVK